ncbi:MAG: hypothetical protein ACPGU1_18665 [Myxococcota bacterium]
MIVASAPGKLMLAGEYAVVGGHGTALSTSLSLRATVSYEEGGDGWRVSSSALNLLESPLEAVPVLRAAAASLGSQLPASGHLIVESELGSGPNKPGFGSSAAVGVAGLAALCAAAGTGRPTLAHAVAVHREAQGGRGSGYDVATALYGGVCAYSGATTTPAAQSLEWLEGLHAAVLYTGRGASTTSHLARLSMAGEAATPALERLGACGNTLLEAWERRDVLGVLAAASAAEVALDRLDAEFGLGIRHGGIAEARAAVEAAGAVARTSGAGGGDCLWVLAKDAATLASAIDAAANLGCTCPEVAWPSTGLEVRGC